MPKVIYMILGGGLGNQMFQYAAARAYQMQYGGELKISTYFYKQGINKDRHYSLENFCLAQEITFASNEEDEMLKTKRKEYCKGILSNNRILPSFLKVFLMNTEGRRGLIHSRFSTYKYIPFVESNRDEVIMFGGFQSPKYFHEISDVICSELQIRTPMKERNRLIAEKMDAEESVCIHVRRGDFLNKEFTHLNICDEPYYRKAVNYILSKKTSAVFYVFSNSHDDIAWIKENYHFPKNTRFVDEENEDYEELQLMCHCKHFIISNSTFSWWAQYLTKNSDKIVCAPTQWDRNYPKETQDIYMPEWVVVS